MKRFNNEQCSICNFTDTVATFSHLTKLFPSFSRLSLDEGDKEGASDGGEEEDEGEDAAPAWQESVLLLLSPLALKAPAQVLLQWMVTRHKVGPRRTRFRHAGFEIAASIIRANVAVRCRRSWSVPSRLIFFSSAACNLKALTEKTAKGLNIVNKTLKQKLNGHMNGCNALHHPARVVRCTAARFQKHAPESCNVEKKY